jgi:membrane protein DedA with SNARE-associated domain
MIYGGCVFANGRKYKTNDLLAFGMWCGATVTGGYMLLSALHLLQVDEESYRFYVGIFGVVLMLWSLQTAWGMLKVALAKREPQSKETSKASDSEGKG